MNWASPVAGLMEVCLSKLFNSPDWFAWDNSSCSYSLRRDLDELVKSLFPELSVPFRSREEVACLGWFLVWRFFLQISSMSLMKSLVNSPSRVPREFADFVELSVKTEEAKVDSFLGDLVHLVGRFHFFENSGLVPDGLLLHFLVTSPSNASFCA